MEVKDLHMLVKPSVAELHFQLTVLTLGQNEDNLVPLAFHATVLPYGRRPSITFTFSSLRIKTTGKIVNLV